MICHHVDYHETEIVAQVLTIELYQTELDQWIVDEDFTLDLNDDGEVMNIVVDGETVIEDFHQRDGELNISNKILCECTKCGVQEYVETV